MTPSIERLFQDTSALPESEQLELVDHILERLNIPDLSVYKAWQKEVEARIEAHKKGRTKMISYEEVMAKYGR